MEEYIVIEAASVEDLTKQVNRMISEGWKTVGGVSIALAGADADYFTAAQAMKMKVRF